MLRGPPAAVRQTGLQHRAAGAAVRVGEINLSPRTLEVLSRFQSGDDRDGLMRWTLNNGAFFAAIFLSGCSALIRPLIWGRLLALVSYLIIDTLPVYRDLHEYAYNNLGLYGLSLVLLPAVFLIGGTMPLIARYFLTAPQQLGSHFSKLYYLNALGACAGVRPIFPAIEPIAACCDANSESLGGSIAVVTRRANLRCYEVIDSAVKIA